MAPSIRRTGPQRFHLQHGPIDCIVDVVASPPEVNAAADALATCFPAILPELVAVKHILYEDLRLLPAKPRLESFAAQRMVDACWPLRDAFITPMAAVAGAVADTLLGHLRAAAPQARRIFVNNGGDIALYLATGEFTTIGLVDQPQRPAITGTLTLTHRMGVGGVATSGWRGRSFSFGIADAVTVLAQTAAQADAAATLIANAVCADHPNIRRAPANSLKDETDLGDRQVTTHVGELDAGTIMQALEAGEAAATRFRTYGAIVAAALRLQGHARFVPANDSAFALSST